MLPMISAPNPPPAAPPGLQDLSNLLISWLKWGVLIASMVGFLVCAIMIIGGRRNRSATAYEGLVGTAWILGGLAVSASAALIIGAFKL